MKNAKKYVVRIDYQKKEILDENFDHIVNVFFQRGVDFELILIDIDNIIDLNMNTIVNRYISDGKKENRPLCVSLTNLKQFILNMIVLLSGETQDYENYDTGCPCDIICGRHSFKVYIPRQYISQGKYDELMALGPDAIQLVCPQPVIFQYILPLFYLFLFKNDLMDDEKLNDLGRYMLGLH